MTTFYQTALDTLVPDLARTLKTSPGLHALNRPAISVVRSLPGYDQDMFIRDALENAGARSAQPGVLDGWTLRCSPTPLAVQHAVRTMLSEPVNGAVVPRVLVVPGVLALPPAERGALLGLIRALDDAPQACHVITTVAPGFDDPLEWSGRTQMVDLDLTPRPDLTAVLLARGACVPGRSPLVRRLFRKQWEAATLLDRSTDALYAQALGEFTAEHLARTSWPWALDADDPMLRMAHASLGLSPDAVEPLLRTLLQRLANHPLMAPHTVGNAWDEPRLDDAVRAALLLALMRPEARWNPARQAVAVRVLRAAPGTVGSPGPDVIDVEWTVVDDPSGAGSYDDPLDSLALDPDPAGRVPLNGWRGWWQRLVGWWSGHPVGHPAPPSGVARTERLVWGALTTLAQPGASERWPRVSVEVLRTSLRWSPDEVRSTVAALVEGLASLPNLWAYDSVQDWGRPGWSMGARHALLTALEPVAGWTPWHQQVLLDALGPSPVEVYTPSGVRATLQLETPALRA